MKKEKSKNLMTDWMRLTVLFVCLCFLLPVAAQTDKGKSITYKCNKEKLQRALMAVERQSGYYRLQYAMEDVAPYTVTANIKNATAEEAVKQLLRGTSLQYEMNGRFIQVYAQKQAVSGRTRTVKGYVRDADGEPLVGVPVCIGEGRVCTVTDADGFYTFPIPVEQTVLKYTYVGMETAYATIPAGSRETSKDIVMRSDTHLDEVVVTGYQEISKPKMTGSVTTISADKLGDRYTANVMNNLEGRVAGLSTYGGKMTIRGTSSLYAETSPLLVVDGIPVEGSIDDINPYDIESVNILKDAAAAAIYGARASAGIIVVTTKNAKTNDKIDIDFSANLTVYEKKNMNYADNFYMTAEQQVDTESKYMDYYFKSGEIADPVNTVAQDIAKGQTYISPIKWAYYQKALGNISETELQARLSDLKRNNYAKDYADAVYRQQVMQQYNLSVRGRSSKIQNNLTLNYKTDNAGIINHFNKAFNAQYKGIFEFAKWLTATFTVNGIYEKSREAGYSYFNSYASPWAAPAYETFWNADGTPHRLNYNYDGNAYMEIQPGTYDLSTTPLEEFYNNSQTTHRHHTRYHGNLNFKIIEGLTAQAQFVYESDHTTVDWLAAENSYVARAIRNAYTTYDAEKGMASYMTPSSGGMLSTTNTDGRYWTARGQVNYSKQFGKHDINALAGLEFRETKQTGTKTLLLGYDDQLQTSATQTVNLGALSQIDWSPYYLTSGGGRFWASNWIYVPYLSTTTGIVTETHHKYGSGYLNATYTYDERYNLFASFRKDYADVYGLNAKFRGKPLWSVGAGWIASNEKFLSQVKWINFLKLRASYGVTGNIYQGATSYMTATSGALNSTTNLPVGVIESPANPNLKWEQNRTTNVGVDFWLMANRLRGAFDYYNKRGVDIFSYMALDPTTGFKSMFMNAADMVNRGIEMQLTYDWVRPKARDSFGWSTNFTLSHNKNEVTNVENPSTTAAQRIESPFVTGYPTSALWSYRLAGISNVEGEKGMTLWYGDNDHAVHVAEGGSANILVYSGQTEPKTMMGMDNSFSWNGFTLSILMAYYGGHVIRALEEKETFYVPYTAIPSYFLNAWDEETNPDSKTPGLGRYASQLRSSEPSYSDISVRKADFLKIRNIVLGYDFPRQWVNKLGINKLSLHIQIDNPKYLWVANKVNVDPETLGIRNPSSFVFGLNVNL